MCVKCKYCNSDTKKMYLNKERYRCLGCKKTFTNGKNKVIKIKNVEELIFLYKEGKSCGEISKEYDCNPETIRYHLKKNGVDTSIKVDNVKCIYCDGKTQKHGSFNDIQKYKCNDCGKFFNENILEYKKNKNKIKSEKYAIIKKMYLVDLLSTTEIGNKLGLTPTGIQIILRELKLSRKIGYAKELKNANKVNMNYDDYIASLPIFKRYRRRVDYISSKEPINKLDNYNKRGKSGVIGAYQLDHKYSILEGFKNDIKPEIIGSIINLEFIPWEENINKSSVCSITKRKLFEEYEKVKC